MSPLETVEDKQRERREREEGEEGEKERVRKGECVVGEEEWEREREGIKKKKEVALLEIKC